MGRNKDDATGNLLDFPYFQKDYRLIPIDLSKQIKLKHTQQINFIGRFERQDNNNNNNNNGATIFYIIEKSEETTFEFLQNSVKILKTGNAKDCKFVKQS